MVRPTRPSFPAPSEPSLRRLGVGTSASADRPLRAQLVVALVALLILIAVPLYLWRRPSGTENAATPSASSSAELLASVLAQQARLEAGVADERVRLGAVQKVRCSPSPAAKGEEGPLCDQLSFFEEALATAIRENVTCAPKVDSGGTINYVMKIDFSKRSIGVFPGASGSWKGPQAKKAAKCVKRSLPAVDWAAIQHRHRFYMIAIMASYPAPGSVGAPGEPTLFE
jgi:hypothetical protein